MFTGSLLTRSSYFLTLSLVLLLGSTVVTFAAEPPRSSRVPLPSAKRTLEIAQLRARLYERVEFPLRLLRLENEIKLAEAQIESFKRLDKEYQQFTKFKYSNPLIHTIETTKLGLLQATLHLKNLKEERHLLRRYFDEERRLRRLLIEQAGTTAILLSR